MVLNCKIEISVQTLWIQIGLLKEQSDLAPQSVPVRQEYLTHGRRVKLTTLREILISLLRCLNVLGKFRYSILALQLIALKVLLQCSVNEVFELIR